MDKAPKDANYELRAVDRMPKRAVHAGRVSALGSLVDRIQKDQELWKRPWLLADYGKTEGANSAATNLRQKHGWEAEHKGWTFRTGRLESKTGDFRHGVYAIYDPEKIVPGSYAKYMEERDVRLAELAARRAEKEEGDRSPIADLVK